MAEQGWLVGELVQNGQLALAGLAVVDLQHISQVLRLLGIQDFVVKLTHHQDNAFGLNKLSVEHDTQAFWGIFTVCLKFTVKAGGGGRFMFYGTIIKFTWKLISVEK